MDYHSSNCHKSTFVPELNPEFTISLLHPPQAANFCRNFRLVVDEVDLMWFKNKENCHVLVNLFHGNLRSKTLRDVK